MSSNNASKQQMGFNSAFKGLRYDMYFIDICDNKYEEMGLRS